MTKSTSKSRSTPSPSQRIAANHKADQGNVNRGTSGTNKVNAKVHGNRGAQMDPARRGG